VTKESKKDSVVSVCFLPGLSGLAARFVTRGEEAGVSTVSTFTSGMTADRSEFARGVLVSFSRLSLVISIPLFFSEFLTAGSNFWVIISCSTKNKPVQCLPFYEEIYITTD